MKLFDKARQFNSMRTRWLMIIYDLLIYAASCFLLYVITTGGDLTTKGIWMQICLSAVIVFVSRAIWGVYLQIWRYGGIQSYIRLVIADAVAFLVFYPLERLILNEPIAFVRALALFNINLLGALTARMFYRYAYKSGNPEKWYVRLLRRIFTIAGSSSFKNIEHRLPGIKVAIIGAGRNGTSLAEELLTSTVSPYKPVLFIDNNKEKVGREIHGIRVLNEDEVSAKRLMEFEVQEVILSAMPVSVEQKQALYDKYTALGCKVKVYDYPVMQNAGRMSIREFDIEELLFRKPIEIESDTARNYYKGKRILITGGGGSIGSEICRQLAKMDPERLIVLDIAENGAYDVQQELRIQYKNRVKINIEIASITDKVALRRVFAEYRPQIVVMAAAHKHVPLMEKNCIEAVKNNVFGTLNTVEVSEEFSAERVIMVSTDKAVNPTNVMGATKRMCEMIVQAHSALGGKTTFSATRFGNVLGSAGSVIPLFKRQIAQGGPVTITDKRIIRYFMTIPEASRLVLQSGAMAKNGELFVLDMGKPVKILELAESMIRLSGADGIQIVETGLRPGEKLYEELLIRSENLSKTENELIFIEHDQPLPIKTIEERLQLLADAVNENSDVAVRKALLLAVPTYLVPDTNDMN